MSLRKMISRCRVVMEDVIFTAPVSDYAPIIPGDEVELEKRVSELRARGYTSVGRVLGEEDLVQLREQLDTAIRGDRAGIVVKWSEDVKYWHVVNPLRLDGRLLRLAAHSTAIAIVERYFQRRLYLSDVDMRRIPPVDMAEIDKAGYSASHWHRDTRGRQVKLMIYLSDVAPSDSNFSLVPATHIGAHRRKSQYLESRLSDAQVDEMAVKPFEWYGSAGDAMLFDTNLVHRLRRKPRGRARDSVTFYYTPGQALRTLDLDAREIEQLPKSMQTIFSDPQLPFKREKIVSVP